MADRYTGNLHFYDRNGEPLDPVRHAHLLNDPDYKRIAHTDLPDSVRVSTIWLGMDHNWGGEPHIFETMIFGGPLDQDCRRYSTEQEALDGHEKAVQDARDARIRKLSEEGFRSILDEIRKGAANRIERDFIGGHSWYGSAVDFGGRRDADE